jgi:hypothetical protein
MAQELLMADFSGGMNALAGVDKLDQKECLLAENVRLDETGNILSAGALTHQNVSPYAAAGGTKANNVHSLFWNPSIGAVAGVGQDVFTGPTLGGMSSKLAGKNAMNQKMSFASAVNRVYFDVGTVGYWTDMTNLLLVDWPPPAAFSGLGGPIVFGTGTSGVGGGFWQTPNAITSTTNTAVTSVGLLWAGTRTSVPLAATMSTNSFAVATSVTGVGLTVQSGGANTAGIVNLQVTLLKNNIPVGTPKIQNVPISGGLLTFGGLNDLWGTTLSSADVNSGLFGFQFIAYMLSDPSQAVSLFLFNGAVTIYGGAAGGMVAGTGTTGTLTGTYTWKLTFVAANGEESDGSPDTIGIVLSGNQGTLTAIPAGDARTTGRNLYRKGGALTSHYLVGSINDNSSTTFSDNLTDLAALTEGVILSGDVPGDFPNSRLGGTNVRFPTYHYDRVFWVNQQQKNQIIWSKPLNGFAYPAINNADVGDSKPISQIVSIFGELIIIKSGGSIWRLTGTDESSFDLTQTPSSVGTDESFTAVKLPDKIPFANRFGLWVFNGYTSQPLTTKLDMWFKQDDRTGEELFGVNGFHPPEVASPSVPLNFEAVANSEKYYLAYAEAGQAQNNAVLVFDLKHGNITKRAGFTPLSLAIDDVTGYVYAGDSSGFVSLLDDWNGATQGGSPANFDFQTGYIDVQRGSNKTLWALEFYLDTDGQSLTPSVYYDSGAGTETLAPISTTSLQRVVRPVEATNSRKMQNFSVRLNGSINPVNKSGAPQIQVVHIKALYDLRTGRARTGQ